MLYKILITLLGITNAQETCTGDVNNDFTVDVNDLLLTLSNFGQNCNDIPNVACIMGDDCGGQIWNECGTSCPLICGEPEPLGCNMMCNVGYQCPGNLWWDRDNGNCVENIGCPVDLPPDIAIGRPFIDKYIVMSERLNIKNDWTYL